MEGTIKLAVNRYAYHWSFPEIVAEDLGLFEKNSIEIDWFDATPDNITNKGSMYKDLLAGGQTDLYHAGEWACIERVLSDASSVIVAKSSPLPGSLNSSFSLYVKRDSDVKRPSDLAGREVAIEPGTGSFYTALQDLERFIPRGDIKLVQGGEPHRRLELLDAGKVAAASLLGPWTDLADELGMRPIIKTERRNPTTSVVRKQQPLWLLKRFFKSVNNAIEVINRRPEGVRPLYFDWFAKVLPQLPQELRRTGMTLSEVIAVPKWGKWEPYTIFDFVPTYRWMTGRGLARPGASFKDVYSGGVTQVFS